VARPARVRLEILIVSAGLDRFESAHRQGARHAGPPRLHRAPAEPVLHPVGVSTEQSASAYAQLARGAERATGNSVRGRPVETAHTLAARLVRPPASRRAVTHIAFAGPTRITTAGRQVQTHGIRTATTLATTGLAPTTRKFARNASLETRTAMSWILLTRRAMCSAGSDRKSPLVPTAPMARPRPVLAAGLAENVTSTARRSVDGYGTRLGVASGCTDKDSKRCTCMLHCDD